LAFVAEWLKYRLEQFSAGVPFLKRYAYVSNLSSG
jgi:hypothetical protein